MNQNLVDLQNLKKEFDGTPVLRGISLSIKRREFVTLLGPSGCGKTTTLRIIGGFEQPDSGDVFFDGKRLNDVPPYQREINTVFQRYALFPHLNVAENIAFGLHIKKLDRADIKRKTAEMLELVGLRGFENRDVTSLSGGQQQRVAIARALVCEPRVLLFAAIGLDKGYLTLILAHVTFCTPYVVLNVMPKLRQLDKNAYEAALDLGATPHQALHKVILPEIMPGIVTGAIMAFTMSIDDFVVSYFTAGTTSQPLSVVIYSMTRHRMTPKINAVSTILFLIVLALLIVINMRQSRDEKRREAARRKGAMQP